MPKNVIVKSCGSCTCSLLRRDTWIKKLWYIYVMEYYTAIKEGTFTFCNSVDGHGDFYSKWNKPVRERQIPYDLTYVECN